MKLSITDNFLITNKLFRNINMLHVRKNKQIITIIPKSKIGYNFEPLSSEMNILKYEQNHLIIGYIFNFI